MKDYQIKVRAVEPFDDSVRLAIRHAERNRRLKRILWASMIYSAIVTVALAGLIWRML